MCSIEQRYTIYYPAKARAKSPSKHYEFSVNTSIKIEASGRNQAEARKNGYSFAEIEAPSALLQKARERYADAELLPGSVDVTP